MIKVLGAATAFAVDSNNMPAFPTFDFSSVGKWFLDGAVSILTSNMVWFIIPGIAIGGIFGAISLIKKTGKKVTKG